MNNNKPLIYFFILCLAFIGVIVLPGILANYGVIALDIPFIPMAVIGSWTPNIAAFIIIAFVLKQKGGVKNLLRRWTHWRINPWWYLVALSPIIISMASAVLYHRWVASPEINRESLNASILIPFLVISLITGAMGEELGWRGFALPRLQIRVNALGASLILGTIWGFWHLPLWFIGMGWEETSFLLFLYSCIVVSVIYTWICNNTNGNMVLVSIFHMSFNYGLGIIGEIWGVPMEAALWFSSGFFTIFALIVILINGFKRLSKNDKLPIDHATGNWIN
jgi:uncharacterized protein